MTNEGEAVALKVVDLAKGGRFNDIRALFPPALRLMVSVKTLEAAWAAELSRRGPLTGVGAPSSEPPRAGMTVVRVPLMYEQSNATLIVALTKGARLAGLQIAPEAASAPIEPWAPPPYAHPDRFAEEDVVLGTGPLAVPGTLSIPSSEGRHPAVVMLAGSGPADRDATLGRNKPFKDIAWGLASQGVVVLRFDKVTYAHADRLSAVTSFTVDDEYRTDAHAAVALLSSHPKVDLRRIYLFGHSLGGVVAPRIAAQDPAIAGMVLAAAATVPLHRTMVRQLEYLASLDPATRASTEEALSVVKRQADLVDSPDLSADTPRSSLPFGVPAAYWLELRAYDPAATAARTQKPVLVIQGGRDYQVTVADDLVGWQRALAESPLAEIRVYDADNHLFFPGSGPPTPAEYEPAQHVDPEVVSDVATWVKSQ